MSEPRRKVDLERQRVSWGQREKSARAFKGLGDVSLTRDGVVKGLGREVERDGLAGVVAGGLDVKRPHDARAVDEDRTIRDMQTCTDTAEERQQSCL